MTLSVILRKGMRKRTVPESTACGKLLHLFIHYDVRNGRFSQLHINPSGPSKVIYDVFKFCAILHSLCVGFTISFHITYFTAIKII